MDTTEFDELPRTRPAPRSNALVLNILTVVILLGAVCLAAVFLSIFINPNSIFNPFPPPTLPAALVLPSITPTPRGALPPTWTPTITPEPASTSTPRPTATLPPTATPFTLITPSPTVNLETPTVSPTPPKGGYPFVIDSRPLAVPNLAHPDLACNWIGVAGRVVDMSGGPKTQLIVVLGGTLGGKPVDANGIKFSLTGVAPAYGQAGYEFVLGDKPVASKGTLWIQLVDQSEIPISEKVYFDTFDSCEKNLIVISFKQVR
jgi:hypothetical protein